MRYFFLKLGPGNSFAQPLLDDTVLGRPMAAGFFRKVRLSEIEQKLDDEKVRFSRQAIELFRWARGDRSGVAVTVGAGRVWVLAPDGPMEEMEREDFEERLGLECPHRDDVPKLVPVRIEAVERLSHVPTLLAQITSNRHLSSSTFKEISADFGNLLALDHVLFKRGLLEGYPSLSLGNRDLYHLLLCLGSNELIALVAKLLEEHGLSVPAPTGGFVRNVDLFAYNDRPRTLQVGTRAFGVLSVPARRAFRHGAVTVQVRGIAAETRPEVSPDVDYLVQLNAEPAANVLNHAWIGDSLRYAPLTRRWMERILRWVPFAGTVMQSLR